MLELPELFAICRKQSSRGPYWQIFQSTKVQNHYEIHTPGWTVRESNETFTEPYESIRPKTVWCKIANGAIREYTYWYLPMSLQIENHNIFVIDFHYKAWLPRPTHRILLTNADAVLRMYNTFEQRYNASHPSTPAEREIYNRFTEAPVRSPTPPRQREVENIHPPGGDPVFFDFQDIPVAATSQNTRPLPIPEIVGSLLIQDAHQGKESCPITTTPYSELHRLTATSCFHVFDTESIERWLTDQKSCPVCRTTVTNMVTKEV